jgi:DNA adenine methylase
MSAAPIVKSAGGKTKLLPELVRRSPPRFENYIEPFFGGGALFFAIEPRRAVIGDRNADLAAMYQAIESRTLDVIKLLENMQIRHSAEFYGAVRDRWNSGCTAASPERAAEFIYLNKTCFNGLWRVNSHGQFNTPIGSYKSPAICDAPAIFAAAGALAGARIIAGDFRETMAAARSGDFVYVDSPYDGTFTNYTADGFSDSDQAELAFTVRTLAARGVQVMVSNSDTPRVRSLYAGMTIDVVKAGRSINSNGKGRVKVNEVIVTAGYERPAIKAPTRRAKGS